MSFVEASSYDEEILEEFNDWSETIHGEIQESGAVRYDSTDVEPLSAEYRKQIGNYLKESFGMDYASIMMVLNGTEATYNERMDNFLVSYDALSSDLSTEDIGRLAHEQGHRLGRKIVDERLKPLEKETDVSPEAYKKFVDYLNSENFAERTKVAAGNSIGHDLSYRMELLEEPPMIYRLKGRLGPEELVDPGREEDLEEMMTDLEDLMHDLSTGNSSWAA
jgi:hypothetical protein